MSNLQHRNAYNLTVINPLVTNPPVIKIVAIGPESSGKSTLCAQLAAHFSTTWCREYARTYLLEQGKDYGYGDLLSIAKGQLQSEDLAIQALAADHTLTSTGALAADHTLASTDALSAAPLLFIDTDMYVMKVWCEFVFGRCHPFILDEIVQRKYDGYLLCNPDLEWVGDALREYPDLNTREQLYHQYKDVLVNQSTPWFEVQGQDSQRTSSAIAWVEGLVKSIQHVHV